MPAAVTIVPATSVYIVLQNCVFYSGSSGGGSGGGGGGGGSCKRMVKRKRNMYIK
jgi:hypothetical protein